MHAMMEWKPRVSAYGLDYLMACRGWQGRGGKWYEEYMVYV